MGSGRDGEIEHGIMQHEERVQQYSPVEDSSTFLDSQRKESDTDEAGGEKGEDDP